MTSKRNGNGHRPPSGGHEQRANGNGHLNGDTGWFDGVVEITHGMRLLELTDGEPSPWAAKRSGRAKRSGMSGALSPNPRR
jgi:hypothetical protein